MKPKLEKNRCYITPDQAAELFKQGLTNKLAIDKLVTNSDTFNLPKRVVVCLSPAYDQEKKRCVFLVEKDNVLQCELKALGLKAHVCQENSFVEKLDLAKQWLKVNGTACLKFFYEMMKVDDKDKPDTN